MWAWATVQNNATFRLLNSKPRFLGSTPSVPTATGSVPVVPAADEETPLVTLVLDDEDERDTGRTADAAGLIPEYHYVFQTPNRRAQLTVERIAWEWHVARYDPELDIQTRNKNASLQQLRFLFAVGAVVVWLLAVPSRLLLHLAKPWGCVFMSALASVAGDCTVSCRITTRGFGTTR